MATIIKLLIFAFLFRAVLAFVVWHPDLNNHVDWGIRFWQYGPEDFYTQNVWSFSWPNQPPGTTIIFAFIRKLFEFLFSVFWWLNVTLPIFPSNIMLFFEERLYQALLKLPAILADLGIAFLIFRFFVLQKKDLPARLADAQAKRTGKAGKIALWGATAFLVNPVVWYNSSIWGQTDSTINFFGILSILLLVERRLVFSYLSFFISLFIKASLLVWSPILLIITFRQRYSALTVARGFLLSAAVLGLLTVPFSGGSEPFSWLFNLYERKVFGQQLHLITANAFNFWSLISGIHERPDTLMLGPLMYRTWGHILFAATLLPLLFKVYKKQDARTVIWVTMLTAFSSFTFLTGMHERYLYPVFPLLTLIVAVERKLLLPFILLSSVHLVNLYNFWWYPRAEWMIEILSAGDRLAPRILGLFVTSIFLITYVYFLRNNIKNENN